MPESMTHDVARQAGSSSHLVVNVIEEARLGGPQTRILLLAVPLKAVGWDTLVVAPGRDSEALLGKAEGLGIVVKTLPVRRPRRDVSGMFAYVLAFLPDVLGYVRLFRQVKPDIVHNNGATQIKVAIAAWLTGTRLVWHLNDTRPERLFFGLFRLLARLACTGFIVSSEATRRAYLAPGEKKPVVVSRPPVDLSRFSGATQAARSHENGIVVAHVGNINPDKDIACLVRLAQRCHARWGDRIVFKLAGQRPTTQASYIRAIDAMIAASPCRVEFVGFVHDIPDFYGQSDIVVCTSRAEAGPMSVFEALAAGRPVVSTDVGDLKELAAQHPGSLKIAPVGDDAGLFEHMADIIDNNRFAAFGRAGRALAEAELSKEAAVAAHLRMYDRIVGAAPPRS